MKQKIDFGKWLKHELVNRGLKQRDLAFRLDVTEQLVSKWVNGYRVPKMSILTEVLYELGYHIEFVKDGDR